MAGPGLIEQSFLQPVTAVSILQRWIGATAPDHTFLFSDDGAITYGDLAPTVYSPGTRQLTVEPTSSLRSVVELMTRPTPSRQLVVLDPRLCLPEKERRRAAAAVGAQREALTILFTSGSTGPARAVRLTSANWAAAVRASAAHLGHGPHDVWLATMPLHHVGGLSILYRSARVGASVRWVPHFDAATVAEELRGRVTIASLVPTMLRRILDHDRGHFSGVRAVLVGGGPIPAGLLEEAHGRGLPVLPTYGMTESCAQVATLRPGSAPRRAAHLLPGVEARIGLDQRIELRGEQISPGYADEDDRPAGAWFRTPDLGELGEDGALTVLGRADDVIVTGGENVDPFRVESILLGHPRVEAVAVVGVAHPEWGMAVAAAYEGTVDPEDLDEWAGPNLASYERPKLLRRLERIPMIGPGKPDRNEVRKILSRSS